MRKDRAMKKKYCLAGVLTLFFMGCAGMMAKLPDPDSSEAGLYRKTCTQCHRLAHPRRNYAYQWEQIVPKMKGYMEKKGIPLSPEDEKVILGYLTRNAR